MNERVDSQSQNESKISPNSETTMPNVEANIERGIKLELDCDLDDDSVVIRLSKKSMKVIVVDSKDHSRRELFLQYNEGVSSALDSIPRKYHIAIQTEPSSVVSIHQCRIIKFFLFDNKVKNVFSVSSYFIRETQLKWQVKMN